MAELPLIGIVGLGLIGGSLALDFTRLGYTVLGASRNQETCAYAEANGFVQQASTDWQILSTAQVVFVCVPMEQVLASVEHLAQVLIPGTVITDVASVKEAFVTQATTRWPWFVGGHPLAGTARQGITAALPQLFKQRPYVLTPIITTNFEALTQVRTLVEHLQAQLILTTPSEHDRAVALISHAPVFISAALLLAAADTPSELTLLAQALASSGFADTTRVGGGNPELGTQMAQFNQVALLDQLERYQLMLTALKTAIQHGNWTFVENLLETTRQTRKFFQKD